MDSEAAILERVIDPGRGGFSVELARQILAWDFPTSDHQRYAQLQEKADAGTLTPNEEQELDRYLSVNNIIAIFKARARASLKQHNPAA